MVGCSRTGVRVMAVRVLLPSRVEKTGHAPEPRPANCRRVRSYGGKHVLGTNPTDSGILSAGRIHQCSLIGGRWGEHGATHQRCVKATSPPGPGGVTIVPAGMIGP